MSGPPAKGTEAWLLRDLLPRVSRSFYLSLRILPRAPGRCIGLAYMLARSADTLSDTEVLPASGRRKNLDLLLRQIGDGHDPLLQQELERELGGDDTIENTLLRSLPMQLDMLAGLDQADREDIRQVLATLISGMQLDLERFPENRFPEIGGLQTAAETEDYCYRVAGCVGEFWTRLLGRHLPAYAGKDISRLIDNGVDFGKALQLTNILRDLREDLLQGRCYLPAEELQQAGIEAARLLDAAGCARGKPVLWHWLGRAATLYGQGRQYIDDIPRRYWQARLAALWPALIGLRTLELLARHPDWPSRPERLKLSRGQVYIIVMLSLPVVCSRFLCNAWLSSCERRLSDLLNRPAADDPPLPADSGPPRDGH